MSATNSTTNYNLPQFISTDKPTWLSDVNGALSTIDGQMKLNADAASNAGAVANTADGKADQNALDISSLSGTVTGYGTRITNLEGSVNGLLANEQKIRCSKQRFLTGSIPGNSNNTVTVSMPSPVKEVLAIIPFGYAPASSWATNVYFTDVNLSGSISFRTVGTSTQAYSLDYWVIYTIE